MLIIFSHPRPILISLRRERLLMDDLLLWVLWGSLIVYFQIVRGHLFRRTANRLWGCMLGQEGLRKVWTVTQRGRLLLCVVLKHHALSHILKYLGACQAWATHFFRRLVEYIRRCLGYIRQWRLFINKFKRLRCFLKVHYLYIYLFSNSKMNN